MSPSLSVRARRLSQEPDALERGLPPDERAPEVLLVLALARRGRGVDPVLLHALAASLADAFEEALDHNDSAGAWERVFGHPDGPVERLPWHRTPLPPALGALFAVPPSARPGTGPPLPPAAEELPAPNRDLLRRWAGWLDRRRREHPRARRVLFPTAPEAPGSAPRLRLAAWSPEPGPGLPFQGGHLVLLDPDAQAGQLSGRSWELAAWLARLAHRRALALGFPGLLAASATLQDERLGGVSGWPDKARALAAWRRWHHRGRQLELLHAREDSEEVQQALRVAGIEELPATRLHRLDALEKHIEGRLLYAQLRPPLDQLPSARRLRPDRPGELDDALPLTAFLAEDDGLPQRLEGMLREPGDQPAQVLAVGPGGVGKSFTALALYRDHPNTALVDLGRAPEAREIPAWLEEQLGGEEARRVLARTPGATVLLDGLDELPQKTVQEQLEAIERALPPRVRRVYLCRDPEVGRRRLGDLGGRVPVYRARPRLRVRDLVERGVPPELARIAVPEPPSPPEPGEAPDGRGRGPDVGPARASLALAELALRVPREGERSPPLIEWIARVDETENTGLDEAAFEALERAGAAWTTVPEPLALRPELTSVFLETLDDGRRAFRHDTWAALYAARHVLRRAELPAEFWSLRWAEPLHWLAQELRDRPAKHPHWDDARRARLFVWLARIRQDAHHADWNEWRALAERTDAAAARTGLTVLRAAEDWRERRDLPGAIAALRALVQRGGDEEDWLLEARILLGRALTEAGFVGAALDALEPVLQALGPIRDPEQAEERLARARGRPPSQRQRLALHGLGALAEALAWATAFERAARLHGAVADYFAAVADDHQRARIRQADALVLAGHSDEARTLRQRELASVPTPTHAFFRQLLDDRLAAAGAGAEGGDTRAPAPHPSAPFRALELWGRCSRGQGDWSEAARAFERVGRELEAAQAWCRAGRAPEALLAIERHAELLSRLDPATEDFDPERWRRWSRADPALATWKGRAERLRALLRAGRFQEAAGLLPPY